MSQDGLKQNKEYYVTRQTGQNTNINEPANSAPMSTLKSRLIIEDKIAA